MTMTNTPTPESGGERGPLRIVGWVPWEDPRPEATTEEHEQVLQAEIRRLNIRRGGFWHQGQTSIPRLNDTEPSEGCPLFSDGTVLRVSMRHWGAIMAAAHGLEADPKTFSEVGTLDMNYCQYAWYGPEEAAVRPA